MAPVRLLLVEDDDDLRSSLCRGLEEHGFAVSGAANGTEALRLAQQAEPVDAVVLDVGLPDADGRDVCRALRARGCAAPVLFLTAHDALEDRLAGFRAGGDDYLGKPFHFAELVVRVRALVRRTVPGTAADDDGVRVHHASGSARHGDRRVELTPTEERLLVELLRHRGDTLRRETLHRAGWSPGAIVHDNTLEQYVARLRRKLRDLGAPTTITTVRGVGYRLE